MLSKLPRSGRAAISSRRPSSISSIETIGGSRVRAAGWATTPPVCSWVTRAYSQLWVITPTNIGFWGEVFDSDDIDGRTSTDMGSGYFAEAGWPWSGYMHNLRAQAMRDGSMADYDGSAELSSPIPISRATSTAVLVGQLCLRRWTRSRLRSLRQGHGESQWQLPGS